MDANWSGRVTHKHPCTRCGGPGSFALFVLFARGLGLGLVGAVLPLRDEDEMVAKLGLDRPLDDPNGGRPADRIKLRHHLTWPEFAEGAALTLAWAGGMLGRERGESATWHGDGEGMARAW